MTPDIIQRIAKREIATKNVDGEAFVNLFIQECIDALAEGYNVVTDLFRASTVRYERGTEYPYSRSVNLSFNITL